MPVLKWFTNWVKSKDSECLRCYATMVGKIVVNDKTTNVNYHAYFSKGGKKKTTWHTRIGLNV